MVGGAHYFHHDTNKNDKDTSSSLAPCGKTMVSFHYIKKILSLPIITKGIGEEKRLLKSVL